MAEKWTDKQLQAITSFNHNILVSAGAGSGKTAVLSERVYRHVGKRKIDINNLLVLTFTNKAAAEMKNRIRSKIIKDDLNIFDDKDFQIDQINKIDTSFIMTFDAYALYLIRKYHYLFNIDKNINVIDDNLLRINNSEFLDEIFNEEYTNKNPIFIDLLDKYCVKDDKMIKEVVLDINQKLEMIYEKDKYISNYENNFFDEKHLDELVDEYTILIKHKISKIRQLENKLAFEVENTNDYYINLNDLYNANTYEEILESLNKCEITSKRLPSGSSDTVKELKKIITESIKELKETLISKSEIIKDIKSTKQHCIYLLKLAEKLNNKNLEYKRRNNVYSFSDIFKMAIELVDKNEDIKKQISKEFKEILIDEYQDTNDLQEEFINRIQNNNVYMVGDIKQSIYRFRNANPDLFKQKYDLYSKDNENELIELAHNFRSKKEVLNGINLIFDRTMDKNIGGADYKKAHHMTSGRKDESISSQNNNLEILNYEYDSKKEEFSLISKEEFEAFVLAKDINEKLGKFFVDDNGVSRKAQYKDFCILADRTKNFDLYKQVLMYYNIPSIIEADKTISDSDLISVIRGFFKIVNCICNNDYSYDFEYGFTSLARSFVFEISDKQIYDILKNKDYENNEVMKVIRKISKDIESKTISEILDEIIKETDLYTKLYKIGDVFENLIKIDYLYQLASTLNSMAYDFERFDEYLRKVFEIEDLDIKYNIDSSNEDAVKIINIHKAKGLEYKICYYVGMDVKFNKADLNKRIIFNKQLGVIIPTYINNRGLKDTILKDLYKYEYDLQDISEKIRLLYVALTRAEDKMIIVGSFNDESSSEEIVSNYERLSYNNYKKLINSIYCDLTGYIKELDFNDYELNRNYRTKKTNKPIIKDSDSEINIKKHFEIEPKEVSEDSFSKQVGLINEDMIRVMDLGSKLHYYLELLDFNNPDYSFVEDEYKDMIKKFMDSDLMKNCKEAKVYKEYEFIYGDENKKHGYIDLLMEYDDHFEIIDYKTKNIDDINYDKQLNGYRDYLESISNKKVLCFLYSLSDSTYREVKK